MKAKIIKKQFLGIIAFNFPQTICELYVGNVIFRNYVFLNVLNIFNVVLNLLIFINDINLYCYGHLFYKFPINKTKIQDLVLGTLEFEAYNKSTTKYNKILLKFSFDQKDQMCMFKIENEFPLYNDFNSNCSQIINYTSCMNPCTNIELFYNKPFTQFIKVKILKQNGFEHVKTLLGKYTIYIL